MTKIDKGAGSGFLCPHGEDYCPKCIKKRAEKIDVLEPPHLSALSPKVHCGPIEGCVECSLESQEVRTTSSTGGQKGVKPERFDLIPVEALEALARHYGKGAEKYEGHQWRKGYEWSKSFAAMMRHAWKFWRGEDIDPETGSPNIICVAWHAFCLYTFTQDFPEFDDRYKG